MCENVVGPICPALEQFADEIANLPAHRFRANARTDESRLAAEDVGLLGDRSNVPTLP